MKSTEIRPHVEAAQRQLRALGKPVPDIDVEALEAQARAAEEELQKPITKADLEIVKEQISQEFRKLFSRRRAL